MAEIDDLEAAFVALESTTNLDASSEEKLVENAEQEAAGSTRGDINEVNIASVEEPGEPELDEEGLRQEYDCVILGTGLVECIVACALQRVGRSVLHLDPNDHYGMEGASLNFEDFLQRCQSGHEEFLKRASGPIQRDDERDMITPTATAAKGEFHLKSSYLGACSPGESIPAFTGIPRKSRPCISSKHIWTKVSQKLHPACLGYIMDDISDLPREESGTSHSIHPVFHGYRQDHSMSPHRAMFSSRTFTVDLVGRVCLAAGAAVTGMVNSDVGKYLEFKAVDGVYYSAGTDQGGLLTVPSSKGGVFSSPHLGPLEKRSLMKFLQFALDRGQVAISGNTRAAITLNERDLGAGRSLRRPQNTGPGDTLSSIDYTQHDATPFHEYLASSRMGERLQNIIAHSLCFLSGPFRPQEHSNVPVASTREALDRLSANIESIGRYGDTPFLAPMYGTGELGQAFCRMCAVWGGTYMLRRTVRNILLSPDTSNCTTTDIGGVSNEDVSPVAVTGIIDENGKRIGCKGFVCNAEFWPNTPVHALHVTRISVCLKELLPAPLGIIVIPPDTAGTAAGNTNAVYCIQSGDATCVAPEGAFLLHLTTRVNSISSRAETDAACMLDKVFERLCNDSSNGNVDVQEIASATIVRPLYTLDPPNLPANVQLSGLVGHSIDVTESFERARNVFERLCPDEDFLPPELPPQAQTYPVEESREDVVYLEQALQEATRAVSDGAQIDDHLEKE